MLNAKIKLNNKIKKKERVSMKLKINLANVALEIAMITYECEKNISINELSLIDDKKGRLEILGSRGEEMRGRKVEGVNRRQNTSGHSCVMMKC